MTLTHSDLDELERRYHCEHADYMARHDSYMKNREKVLEFVKLCRTSLNQQNAQKQLKLVQTND